MAPLSSAASKTRREVLLRLADVLAHHRREIDPVEIELQLIREHLGRHRLAGAALAREQRADAQGRARPCRQTPIRRRP